MVLLKSGAGQVVLLTGSRGFTGAYVRSALQAAGYRVAGLVDGPAAEDEVSGNLLDVGSLQAAVQLARPDFVIHLAGIASVDHSDPMSLYNVNFLGSMNLLKVLAESDCSIRKVVLASTSNVYGDTPLRVIDESCPPAPVNHYAMSKLAMEHGAAGWAGRFPIVTVRPFNYTGPGQSEKFLIPKIVGHFVRREASISLGNLDVTREFNDVRAVAQIYVRLMERAPNGLVVNLCSGVGHKLLDVVQQVEQITGHTLEVNTDPKLVRQSEIRYLVGDASRLAGCIGALPGYELADTLRAMVEALG